MEVEKPSPKRQRTDEADPKRAKIDKPKKADFRQRAHCNPLSDFLSAAPLTPRHVDWRLHFPEFIGICEDFKKNNSCSSTDSRNFDTAFKDFSKNFKNSRFLENNELHFNTIQHPISYPDSVISPENSKIVAQYSPDFLDIGCGFGGLTVDLARQYPDKLVMGLEIREQVTNYVGLRIEAFKQAYKRVHYFGESKEKVEKKTDKAEELARNTDFHYFNATVLRTNAMKTLVNYHSKRSVEKMFFCFPDPHFKKKTWRRRIVNDSLLSMYAYVLKPKGKIYCITDVKDLHEWMYSCLKVHPLFDEVTPYRDEEVVDKETGEKTGKMELTTFVPEKGHALHDPCIDLIHSSTEEGQKVKNLGRFGHKMFYCVFQKKE